MKTLAIIPARGGSKRVPRKNLAPCANRPLLAWTAEAVRNSRSVSRAILSTDDPEIAAAGRELGFEVPFLRPTELSRDDTPMLPVLQHLLRAVQDDSTIDAVILLQPSSPLRTGRHIDEAVALFQSQPTGSVVSVTVVPHQYNPYKVMQQRDGALEPFLASEYVPGAASSALPPVFVRNGPAIVVSRPADILAGTLYANPCRPYLMQPEDSIDIDTPFDLMLADAALRQRTSEGPA
ncbi:MAG: acylneuraminate cytidylyltransferase family protein [Ferrovibrio sp.]|uniref:acylneuraminate cytidylyltransferase family protein n=1 Tax=Ferrovibrio sp. TaxID=1917215 RepID=UPI00262F9934|nr:acylneuraminate cytidylyltransferase family protein [Ferrovibrio sp.]MCW0234925.1 acylneuraminate cytidylyltransferase family protein [Ferrovibrio sp.]